jgi:methylated-DNA-protein-cysteine methyltransferase-like protein
MRSSTTASTSADRPAYVDEVLAVVAQIPAGRVMSYGDVAHYVGLRSARLVGSVMRRYGGEVPWHRVVMADGSPKPFDIGGREQLALLRDDRTPLAGNRVDMARARWDGT